MRARDIFPRRLLRRTAVLLLLAQVWMLAAAFTSHTCLQAGPQRDASHIATSEDSPFLEAGPGQEEGAACRSCGYLRSSRGASACPHVRAPLQAPVVPLCLADVPLFPHPTHARVCSRGPPTL